MARNKPVPDPVWEEIFDTLTVDGRPPSKYIKNVMLVTRNGERRSVSAEEFSAMLDDEQFMEANSNDIVTCKLSIDFAKVKKDVDRWVTKLIDQYDHADPVPGAPEKRKRKSKNNTDSV
jgi:hypothetical protein